MKRHTVCAQGAALTLVCCSVAASGPTGSAPQQGTESAQAAAAQADEHGGSPITEGEPTEMGLLADADAGLDLLFEDFDVVVTASRSSRSSADAPVRVHLLTAEDIRYSGVGYLADVFEFVPGVDAFRVDRNRWAVGVRGLHQVFSDRTLFLLDGRIASNPLFGGIDFQTLPAFLPDIERIETVRGPASGAWGANALNGVINVIQKSPRDTTGVLLVQRFGEYGETRSNIRVGDATEEFAWRISAEFGQHSESGDDYVLEALTVGASRSTDYARSHKLGFDGEYELGASSELTFGVAHTHVERGDAPFVALQSGQDERHDLLSTYAKLTLNEGHDTNGYIQWYGTYYDVNQPSIWRYQAFDSTLEGQINFKPAPAHETNLGASIRVAAIDIDPTRATDAVLPGQDTEYWLGGFIADRWTLSEKWTLESHARVDWYSETHIDWAARLALLHTLDDEGAHRLRFSFAKAFRTPQTTLREFSAERVPLGPNLFGFQVVPAQDVDNEEIYSFELGYNGKLDDALTLRIEAYYQIYKDLTGSVAVPEPVPVIGRQFFTLDNDGEAISSGIETELAYEQDGVKLGVWYAYNHFSFERSGQTARAFLPARHKAGALVRAKIDKGFVLNANYRFTDAADGQETFFEGDRHRLDLTATMDIPDSPWSVQVGVQDVFNETRGRVNDLGSLGVSHETPGQTFFIQFQAEF